MKNFVKALFAAALILINCAASHAMLGENESETRYRYMNATGFADYPPFGTFYRGDFSSLFDDFIKDFCTAKDFEITYMSSQDNYNQDVQDVRTGNIDFIIGMYSATDEYRGIEFIYPAATINPIHIATLPERTEEIQTIDDLKGLKGLISAQEHLSDYINDKIGELQIEKNSSSYDMFEKLAKGEVDYIIGSRYFLMIESAKLGIKDKISFSKKAVWNIPVFFGVSKAYRHRGLVMEFMGKELKKPEVQQKINNYLIQMIHNIERENAGVVPPTFINK
ncbi:MAG: transporter substrate-binding domain-containing protein [Lactobacillaceae bacterium]|jgi:ABC-type amino acid transport substrate-binding protein|nr:transporter substrate-binding domain-containing protein [Lactobacillaceae bacterium]